MGASQSSPQTKHNYLCREIAHMYKDCHSRQILSTRPRTSSREVNMELKESSAHFPVVRGTSSKEQLAPSSVGWGQVRRAHDSRPPSSLLPSLGGELINLDRRRRLTKHLITFSMRGGIVVIILSASRLASTGSKTWKQSSQII